MPTNRRSRRPKPRNGRVNSRQASIPVLKDIRDIVQNQSIRAAPMVHDVQKMTLSRNRVCSFAITYPVLSITTNTVNPQAGGIAPTFDSLPGYSSLASCFDQYRIMQCVVFFEPRNPVAALAAGGTISTAIDYDDIAAPAANDLQQYDTNLDVPIGTYFERVLNPHIAYAAYATGAFTSYANQRAGWLDVASPSVPHYGLKYFVTSTTASIPVYDVKCTVLVQFRSQR